MRPGLRILLATIFFLAAAAGPAAASEARLLSVDGRCVGVVGEAVPGARVALEECSGGADQVWDMPPRGDQGRVQLGGFCLEGNPVALALCTTSGVRAWIHGADGWLITGTWGPEPTRGQCLGGSDELAIVSCTGGEDQIFFAEGHDAWTPAVVSAARPFLPIETSFPFLRYGHVNGVFQRSTNYGRTYEALRPAFASDVFAVSPANPYHVWTIGGGRTTLDRSRDGGGSFTPMVSLPSGIYAGHPRIVPSRRDDARIYVYGLGLLWASRDGGETFSERGPLPGLQLSETELLDLGDGVLVFLRVDFCLQACAPENVRVWRSADDGASWLPVFTGTSAVDAVRLVEDPHRAGELYLILRPAAAARDSLVRSTDGGRTFVAAGELPSRDGQLVFDRYDADRRFLFALGGLWRSEGGGWQELAAPHAGQGAHEGQLTDFGGGFLRIAVINGERGIYFDSYDAGDSFQRFDPSSFGSGPLAPLPVVVTGVPGHLYFLGGSSNLLQRSEDGGASWRSGARLDGAREIVADPRDPDRVFALLPGGLQLSENGGLFFEPLSGPAAAATALAVYTGGIPVTERTVVVAAGTPSFQISHDGGSTWSAMPSPRPAERFGRLVGNSLVLFAVGEQGDLFRTYDEGQTWERLAWVNDSLVFGSGLLAYVEGAGVRVSDDGGATFADRYPPDLLGDVAGLHIGERNDIYVAGLTTVLRSGDRGRTWQSLGRDLLKGHSPKYAVAADPFEPGKLYHSGALGLHLGRFTEAPPLDLGERFEARVRWRDYLGQTGQGVAQALTRDSGLFWLFTAGRAEVSVKVLDGRGINGKFWVFLASMTDVELHLQIEDRTTGQIWSYFNPLGNLLSFGDIEAFPRTERDPVVAAAQPPGSLLLGTAEQVLIGDRFEVEVDWTADGESGPGQGRQLNAETAAFYFFDRANVELIVNVLDGRSINGKFWVYFGSLSNVAYTVTIKDRLTGRLKTYENPAGTFASRGDTEAFE